MTLTTSVKRKTHRMVTCQKLLLCACAATVVTLWAQSLVASMSPSQGQPAMFISAHILSDKEDETLMEMDVTKGSLLLQRAGETDDDSQDYDVLEADTINHLAKAAKSQSAEDVSEQNEVIEVVSNHHDDIYSVLGKIEDGSSDRQFDHPGKSFQTVYGNFSDHHLAGDVGQQSKGDVWLSQNSLTGNSILSQQVVMSSKSENNGLSQYVDMLMDRSHSMKRLKYDGESDSSLWKVSTSTVDTYIHNFPPADSVESSDRLLLHENPGVNVLGFKDSHGLPINGNSNGILKQNLATFGDDLSDDDLAQLASKKVMNSNPNGNIDPNLNDKYSSHFPIDQLPNGEPFSRTRDKQHQTDSIKAKHPGFNPIGPNIVNNILTDLNGPSVIQNIPQDLRQERQDMERSNSVLSAGEDGLLGNLIINGLPSAIRSGKLDMNNPATSTPLLVESGNFTKDLGSVPVQAVLKDSPGPGVERERKNKSSFEPYGRIKMLNEAYKRSPCSAVRETFVGAAPLFAPCNPSIPRHLATWGTLPYVGPFNYIKQSKNPCFYNELGRVRCVPYFFMAGFSRCATTDLYSRLLQHPQVAFSNKQAPWFSRLRFSGYSQHQQAFNKYIESFNGLAFSLASDIERSGFSNKIIGDYSTQVINEVFEWRQLSGNEACTEPRIINANHIRHLYPDVKIIVIMRHPVQRLYSRFVFDYDRQTLREYRRQSKIDESLGTAHMFHLLAADGLQKYYDCFLRFSLRSCIYNRTLWESVHGLQIQESLYAVLLEDWLRVIPRDQMLFLRTEDYQQDMRGSLETIFTFLGLDPISKDQMQKLISTPRLMVNREPIGAMLPKTQTMLRNFFTPFMDRLADLLGDVRFRWNDIDL